MNTSRTPLVRTVGAYTLLLGLVLVLLVGGIIATDQTLNTLAVGWRRAAAARAASQLDRIAGGRAGGLSVFNEFVASAHVRVVDSAELKRLAKSYHDNRAGTLRLELMDSAGKVVYEDQFDDTTSDAALLGSSTVGFVPTGTQPLITARTSPSGVPLLLVAQPLGDAGHGSALAVFDFRDVVDPITSSKSDSGESLEVITGDDTIAVTRGGRVMRPHTTWVPWPVTFPDSTSWMLNVGEADEVYGTRRLLWFFGATTVLLLGLAVLRERRQAVRIRERSAELERLSSELLRANRMKSEFLASVSHELRTPLNAIVGFVELLKDGVYGDLSARQVGPVDRIAVSAMHLRHLVDQILDIAKIAAGRLEIHTETVSLRIFVVNVASELESLFNERGLSLSISIPATLPRIRTDPTHLRQILVNLIGNAIKYTPAGGVVIRARLVGTPKASPTSPRRLSPEDAVIIASAPDLGRPWVALQIVDTGIGIPSTDYGRIFDEFEQVNPGSRGDSIGRGTGLGLPISRRLARLLGGDVTVDSQLAKGSTFTVWIAVQPGDLTPSLPPRPVVESAPADLSSS